MLLILMEILVLIIIILLLDVKLVNLNIELLDNLILWVEKLKN